MPLDPSRTVAELQELRELTGDENGAQRVAWTDTWETRARLAARQARRHGRARGDRRGRQPVVHARRGPRERAPDRRPPRLGAERRLARRLPQRHRRRRGVPADRRGGDAAGAGAARQLGRRGGRALRPLALRLVGGGRLDARPGRAAQADATATASRSRTRSREHGVDLDRALEAARAARGRRRLPRAAHRAGPGARVARPPARRRARHLRRRALAHHLARPGRARRLDADGPAPRRARRRREARARDPHDRAPRRAAARSAPRAASSAGRGSSPRSSRRPSSSSTSATSTPARSRACSPPRRRPPSASPRRRTIEVEWERIWNIEPILFDDTLIDLADEAIREVAGTSHRLPSGPLHDAAEVSRAGVPTVMLFVQSLRGLSHTKLEDTKPEHLELSVQALDRLAVEDARLARAPERQPAQRIDLRRARVEAADRALPSSRASTV